MTQEQFDYLCEKFGNQDLPVGDRWKSIQSLHIFGSYEPFGSFQSMVNNNQVWYIVDPTLGPGFIYVCAPDPAYELINDNYNVSWLGLEYITEVTFVGSPKFNDKTVVDITDIVNYLAPGTITEIPVVIALHNFRVKIGDETSQIEFSYNREELESSDFKITYSDASGAEIDKPTRVGDYKVTVECIKDGYKGSASSKYTVYSIR